MSKLQISHTMIVATEANLDELSVKKILKLFKTCDKTDCLAFIRLTATSWSFNFTRLYFIFYHHNC